MVLRMRAVRDRVEPGALPVASCSMRMPNDQMSAGKPYLHHSAAQPQLWIKIWQVTRTMTVAYVFLLVVQVLCCHYRPEETSCLERQAGLSVAMQDSGSDDHVSGVHADPGGLPCNWPR